MMSRCFVLAALTALASVGAVVHSSAAEAPQTNRGRAGTQNPRPANPAPAPTPAPGSVSGEAPVPPPPPPPPPSPPSTPTPRRENQSVNIRIDVTVTDQRPSVAPLTKTVSVVTGDGLNGSVRSQTNYQAPGAPGGSAPFNVDAMPVILADGKVHVRLGVQYDVVPPPGSAPDALRLLGTTIRDSVALVLESGKPIVAVQSTDPVSDRKVSVEVKATVLR